MDQQKSLLTGFCPTISSIDPFDQLRNKLIVQGCADCEALAEKVIQAHSEYKKMIQNAEKSTLPKIKNLIIDRANSTFKPKFEQLYNTYQGTPCAELKKLIFPQA